MDGYGLGLGRPPQARMPSKPTPADIVTHFPSLLRSARAGDEGSWDTIYRWLAPQVLRFLRASRIPDAEDVLGDVFLDVARSIDDFRGDDRGFRAWVFTIARARRVDEIRRRARRHEQPFDSEKHGAIPAPIDVEGQALSMVRVDEMLDLLDLLTDDQAEVLILRGLGGWSSRQIAEITDRTIGSVEQLQHRAAKSLRAILTARKESATSNDYTP